MRSPIRHNTIMKPTVIRYTTKPEHTQRNAQLVEGVFRELGTAQPEGVRYLVLQLDDGTFIHVVAYDGDDAGLTGLRAFQQFVDGGEERRAAPPLRGEATVLGNYRMLTE
ncbi:MAG: hypothetical protein JWN27_1430 [Candidatus Eremiobacteraeota bacterium]|nr:hypothetical protein [Candidatus Eremiobacteraeota bacterium]